MDQIIQYIDSLDKEYLIYQMQFHFDLLDKVMHQISGKLIWTPLYALIIYQLFKQTKTPFSYLICLLLSVGAADFIASGLAKPYFERLRPCRDELINQWLDLSECGGEYGFFSSHSSISFAIAGFVFFLNKKWGKWLLLWAGIIAYSRIHLCVHYPSDIIMGAITGIGLSLLFYRLSERLSIILNK